MTPEELSRMTLADFEAASERWGKAAQTLREVRALMGPAVMTVPNSAAPMPPGVTNEIRHVVHPGIAEDPESMAIRQRLLAQRQAEMNRPAAGVDAGALSE